jgi:hypothetical protein
MIQENDSKPESVDRQDDEEVRASEAIGISSEDPPPR